MSGQAPDRQVKVLYIMGKGRSGTTLLNSVLGQLEGFVSVGELEHLWDRGLHGTWRCGCGAQVVNCEVWSRVIETAFGDEGVPSLDPRLVHRWQDEVLSVRKVPKMLRKRTRVGSGWLALDAYVEAVSRVYRALAQVNAARVVVDSTKVPLAPTPLGKVPGIETYLVHLIRDPRAVVHSWQRPRRWDPEVAESMPTFGPVYTSASWSWRNLQSELAVRRNAPERSLRVRYEDFVARPVPTVQSILRMTKEPTKDLSWLTDTDISLRPIHSVGGNPIRHRPEPVRFEVDDEWRGKLSRTDRLVATALAFPFLHRYGYSFSPFVRLV